MHQYCFEVIIAKKHHSCKESVTLSILSEVENSQEFIDVPVKEEIRRNYPKIS